MRGIWITNTSDPDSGTLPSSVKFGFEDREDSSDDEDARHNRTDSHNSYSEETSSDIEGETDGDGDSAKVSTMTSSFGVLAVDDVDEV